MPVYTRTGASSSVDHIFWSPDSKHFTFDTSTFPGQGQRQSTSTVQVWVWDATTGITLHLYTYTSSFPSMGISWSPDDKHLAFTPSTYTYSVQGQRQSTNTIQVWVWDATTGITLHLYTYTGPSTSVAIKWSPDSRHLAFTPNQYYLQGQRQSTSTVQVWVWDATTGITLPIYTFTGTFTGSSPSVSIFWSPDSKHFAFTPSTSKNPVQGQSTNTVQVWVWDATTGKTLLVYTLTGQSSSVGISWSPDSKHLTFNTSTYNYVQGQGQSTNTVQVWVWDATTGKTLLVYTLTGPSTSVANIFWSLDGKQLVFTTSTYPVQRLSTKTVQVRVWDIATRENLSIYTGSNSSVTFSNSSMGSMSWSPTDGKHLVFVINSNDPSCETISGTCNGIVLIWDATTKGSIYILRLSSSAVNTIDWSPDGTRIASVSADGTLYVWYAV